MGKPGDLGDHQGDKISVVGLGTGDQKDLLAGSLGLLCAFPFCTVS